MKIDFTTYGGKLKTYTAYAGCRHPNDEVSQKPKLRKV